MTKNTMKTAAVAADILHFDDWADAIEDAARAQVRGFIEVMPEEELRTSRRVSYCGDRTCAPVGRWTIRFYNRIPRMQQRREPTRGAEIASFHQCSIQLIEKASVANFIGKSIHRPDRFLSVDRHLSDNKSSRLACGETGDRCYRAATAIGMSRPDFRGLAVVASARFT